MLIERNHWNIRKRQALAATLASTLTLYGAGTLAEEIKGQEDLLEEVTVTGILGSLKRAMDVKRDAVGVVDAIASEDIGKFPDQNVAESLQRIPGVSIDRSGGEGQYVTVRGLGPQFNSVLVNGRQIATENQGREFSFDTLAAELIAGADIYKSPTAAMQEGGIGATINVKTARPLDLDEFTASGSLKGVHDDLTGETSPSYSGLVSNTFADGTMGVLLSVSHSERNAQNNLVETRYYRPGQSITTQNGETYNGVYIPQNFDVMVDEQDRSRTNANAVFQFAPNENMVITADAMYSAFEVESDTHALGHWFTDSNIIDAELGANDTLVFLDSAATGATDFIRRTYNRDTETKGFGLNLDWQINDNLNAKIDLSTSTAEDNSGGNIPFTVIGYNNAYQWDGRAGDAGSITIAGGQDALLNASAGRAHYNERNGWDREDEITELKADFEWTPDSQTLTSVKYGFYYQDRTKDNQRKFASDCSFYCGYGTDVPDELLRVYNAENFFGGLPSQWLTYDIEAYFDYLATGGVASLQQQADEAGQDVDIAALYAALNMDNPNTAADKFSVEEEIVSVYLDLTLEGEIVDLPWQLNLGVRYSQTDSTLGGFTTELSDLQPIPNDPSDLNEVYNSDGTDVNANNEYTNILPSANLRLDLNDDMLVRLGFSKTLTRPTMDDLVPATTITVSRPDTLQAVGGNPDLKPFLSTNLDLSFEWYYDAGSYFSAAVFTKDVEDFITGQVATETYNLESGAYEFSVLRPRNGEEATIDGLELAWTHIWENGFGIQANATFVDSDAELDPNDINESFGLEGLGDSHNIVLFYERGPLQARIAYNNRGDFLQNVVNPRGGTEPLYTEEYAQWDISASYDVTDKITVFFEGVNITEEETRRHGRFSNQLISLEDNGARYAIGIRANY
ncbi:TonB-dependent receptor [Pseudomaricurvus alkylphenolicus]|uniref:TonB-dependent receptor n=1 Tax=Pseudomaricurvus alkylphenolicus TaxID=1306991 RepID=UPI00141F398D|nr:TonB-dependent receptor [Pseudomaricurvus alkylphenolicus]NIB44199.1 TonB-dependent receptor [Pseudomaricurvus alkylphenolicus]